MTPEQYADFPDELAMREARVDHQVLVTTLLDDRQVSKDDLSALYARRWNVERDLRNLKTTRGMDVLVCQTPQMNEKQLWVPAIWRTPPFLHAWFQRQCYFAAVLWMRWYPTQDLQCQGALMACRWKTGTGSSRYTQGRRGYLRRRPTLH